MLNKNAIMKNLKEYIKEGLFDGIDNIENTNGLDNANKGFEQLDKEKIIDWIKENYKCIGLKISKKPNKNGLYEASAYYAEVKNRNITSLTNEMFEWKKTNDFYCLFCHSLTSLEGAPKKVGGNFYCLNCTSLKSLEGAPKEVGRNFDCANCSSLTSLECAPKKVGGDFYCGNCESLKSLEGAPKEVGGGFVCSDCKSLESLVGAPKKVAGWFDCYGCASLESLEGAPKEVGVNFYCYGCKIEFTEDDIRKVSDVKGKIVIKLI